MEGNITGAGDQLFMIRYAHIHFTVPKNVSFPVWANFRNLQPSSHDIRNHHRVSSSAGSSSGLCENEFRRLKISPYHCGVQIMGTWIAIDETPDHNRITMISKHTFSPSIKQVSHQQQSERESSHRKYHEAK